MKFKNIILIIIAAIFLAGFILVYSWLSVTPPRAPKVTWGINFSQMQAEDLRMDWKKMYTAILSDLGVRHIKLMTQWDYVEDKRGAFYFDDVDWQVKEAQKYQAKMIYVVGMKSGRWPECHLPNWVDGLSKNEQQDELLKYVEASVNRYKNNSVIEAWQVENEALFNFGECPWYDQNFLKKEVALVKSLDTTRPVIISDSGEQSFWMKAASIGDVVGITTYRKLWFGQPSGIGFYGTFPIPPSFYYQRAQLIKKLFGKKVIGVELQAEPWAYKKYHDVSLREQEKTMNVDQFNKNVEYARATGFDTFYFWGTEWWYWLKENQGRPEIWNEAKKLFTAS